MILVLALLVLTLFSIFLDQAALALLELVLDLNLEAVSFTLSLELRDTTPALLYLLTFYLVGLTVNFDVVSTLGDLLFGSHKRKYNKIVLAPAQQNSFLTLVQLKKPFKEASGNSAVHHSAELLGEVTVDF